MLNPNNHAIQLDLDSELGSVCNFLRSFHSSNFTSPFVLALIILLLLLLLLLLPFLLPLFLLLLLLLLLSLRLLLLFLLRFLILLFPMLLLYISLAPHASPPESLTIVHRNFMTDFIVPGFNFGHQAIVVILQQIWRSVSIVSEWGDDFMFLAKGFCTFYMNLQYCWKMPSG